MQSLQATPWFDGHDPPAREGPYQRRYPAGPYSCWAQGRWYGDAATPQAAAAARSASRWQHAAWRGVSTPSDAPCAACRGSKLIDLGFDAETGDDLIAACADCDPE
ncbi:hypothetical protein [Aquincola sp. J276]|uniref:hypothetical protein n=1 Tax=Aquincola sp. J276 TaxID=2898432 RepID=UPI0021515020|nr:hypothetical protein [Aquincola sp. J276]MCR5869052.1 hypothetical protein [Aquincola sp. J276]